MDRVPFSAFLLLLVGIVLLAQFVNGSLWTFIDGLLGTSTATSSTTTVPRPVQSTQTGATAPAGNRRTVLT